MLIITLISRWSARNGPKSNLWPSPWGVDSPCFSWGGVFERPLPPQAAFFSRHILTCELVTLICVAFAGGVDLVFFAAPIAYLHCVFLPFASHCAQL